MKRIFAIVTAMVLALGLVVATAAPASAYTTKQKNKVWSFVKANDPSGASIMGKIDTISHAKDTCKSLRAGLSFDELAWIYASVAIEYPDSVGDAFLRWAATTDVAAVTYMCKDQQWQLDLI